MQRNPHLFRRCGLATAVTAIAAVSSVGAPAPLAAEDEPAPAQLIELSGPIARALAQYGNAEPVLVTYTADGWAAIVFADDASELPGLLERLLVQEIPDCIREGAVECCDQETETLAINTDRGWSYVGEKCGEDVPLDYDDESGPGVDLTTVPEELARQLYECCGVVDYFMDLANPDRSARMLINPLPRVQLEHGERSLPPAMQRTGAPHTTPIAFVVPPGPRSPIILTHDHPPPSVSCVSSVDKCRATDDPPKRCHSGREHWYRKVKLGGTILWCHRAGCNCP